MKVAVLLSTFNGEKFLKQQIESIKMQENVEPIVIIRDDGSKDSTVEIISEYVRDGSVNVIHIDKLSDVNLGVQKSYFRLLDYAINNISDAAYFAFCDQDDVWLPHKLCVAVDMLQNVKSKRGGLYYSNKTLVDSDLEYIEKENLTVWNDFYEIFWKNLAYGCTMVITREFGELLIRERPDSSCGHDVWAFRLAKIIGADVFFDSESYIKYRQHDKNVVGSAKIHHGFNHMAHHFFSNLTKKRVHWIQQMVIELSQKYADCIDPNILKYIKYISDYTYNPLHKFLLIFSKMALKRGGLLWGIWTYNVLFNMI